MFDKKEVAVNEAVFKSNTNRFVRYCYPVQFVQSARRSAGHYAWGYRRRAGIRMEGNIQPADIDRIDNFHRDKSREKEFLPLSRIRQMRFHPATY